MAFFSVLIPVYNQVGKMQKCMDSLKNQTFTDYEVIMVDDGSTDASYEMLCGFAEEDDRIKVIKQEKNSSLVGARYVGMQNATGEYVFFLDSDDSISTDAFEKLHDRLTKTYPDILRFAFEFEYTDKDPEPNYPVPSDDMLEMLFTGGVYPSIWKNVYKRSVTDKLVETTEPFYCNMSEDVYFSTVFYTFGKTVETTDDVLYYYQCGSGMSSPENQNNLTFAKYLKTLDDTVAAGDHMRAFLQKYNPDRVAAAEEAINRMQKFVFYQHVRYETDNDKITNYLNVYKEKGLLHIYEPLHAECLKIKALRDAGELTEQKKKELYEAGEIGN